MGFSTNMRFGLEMSPRDWRLRQIVWLRDDLANLVSADQNIRKEMEQIFKIKKKLVDQVIRNEYILVLLPLTGTVVNFARIISTHLDSGFLLFETSITMPITN